VITYGIKSGDIRATHINYSLSSTSFKLDYKKEIYEVNVPLVGEFNVYNILAVISALVGSGFAVKKIVKHLAHISQVPGRMEKMGKKSSPKIFIDYAHTPDALQKALQTLKGKTDGKLICVFGCGGNRDTGKRKEMAIAASKFADMSIVTSDNPRNENPKKIIREISKYMKGSCSIEIHRDKAIEKAIQLAHKEDVILIAGKGHEKYQEIKGIKYPFSDQKCVRNALKHHKIS
jgi:UDP-N-acetylmuramoyl-L-alanyl-D-glutamate--2,6-diaminopimelate ligase